MVTKEQAEEICYRQVNRPRADWPDMPEFVVTQTDERERTWAIYYQSKRYLETRSASDAIAGNGPCIVSKLTGHFTFASTAVPHQLQLQEAEAFLAAQGQL